MEDSLMGSYRKATLTEQLPPTPCTPEMRSQMLEIAKEQGTSLAEVQRRAFSLFLSRGYSKSIDEETKTIDMEVIPT